ncbi:FadR/GntR family transcriptional regulator [Actinomycetospora sp. TBRC 11914]|uniref:FadR/GntR family transcriptional regulator n=1 Tax=Actinomycetospora sp. TBRC 11914 TaxID=2729387 RepID=UPI00145F31EF|nr:GntR family transcriptional regulator [Actinomycetospora sp. TBRC 11914]NMO92304.1 FadR family transcriptional regulator [Actinomycetospora sp. TBRC 11914]
MTDTAGRSAATTSDHRAYRRMVDDVEARIASGELRPGDRLPSERDLVDRYAIARSSVREALRVLESLELVRSAPRDPRGPLVLPMSAAPIRRSLGLLTSSKTISLPQLVQLRMVLDASTNLMAAVRRTPEHLVALERNMARMRALRHHSYAEFGHADLEFHEILADAAGHELVRLYGEAVREAVLDLIQQTILDAEDQAAQMLRSIRHHAAVFDAVQAGDALAASRLARESLYQYYADHVGDEDREIMADLVRECGGRVER